MALQIRRGTDAERSGITFDEGELIYVLGTNDLYVGDGSTSGGILVGGESVSQLNSMIIADTQNNEIDLLKDLNLSGKNIIGSGNITIDGTITATGNINIGDDANSDTVDFTAKITSSLTPQTDSAHDLGASNARWRNAYLTSIFVDGAIEAEDVKANILSSSDSSVILNANTSTITGTHVGDVQATTLTVDGVAITTELGAITTAAGFKGTFDGDLNGSVYSDNSTILVDGVNAKIVGDVDANNINGNTITGTFTGNLNGNVAGNLTGNVTGTLVGNVTGDVNGSVSADDSTPLVDGASAKIVGKIDSTDGVNTVSMGNSLLLRSSGGVTLDALSGQTVNIGTGDTGPVNIGTNTSAVTLTGSSISINGPIVAGNIEGDLSGSVFADDSTPIINAQTNKVTALNMEWANDLQNGYLNITANTISIRDVIDDSTVFEGGEPFISIGDSIFVGPNYGLEYSAVVDSDVASNIYFDYITSNTGNTSSILNTSQRGGFGDLAVAHQNNDTIFSEDFQGFDGTSYVNSARLKVIATNVATGAITTELRLEATADGNYANANGVTVKSTHTSFDNFIQLEVLAVAPTSPANGMIAIADGSGWDPLVNGQQSMVVYLNGGWRQIAVG